MALRPIFGSWPRQRVSWSYRPYGQTPAMPEDLCVAPAVSHGQPAGHGNPSAATRLPPPVQLQQPLGREVAVTVTKLEPTPYFIYSRSWCSKTLGCYVFITDKQRILWEACSLHLTVTATRQRFYSKHSALDIFLKLLLPQARGVQVDVMPQLQIWMLCCWQRYTVRSCRRSVGKCT
jgi:hypothetical protein